MCKCVQVSFLRRVALGITFLKMTLEEELLKFVTQWDKAMVSNDVEEIGKFMSEDWVIVGTAGGVTDRSSFLEWIRSGDVVHTRMDADETRIKVYGNTGVVITRGTSAGNYSGEPFSLYEWSLNVFIYDGKNWLCVATMLTDAKP
jgi:ketosteroid isomerase-like protein